MTDAKWEFTDFNVVLSDDTFSMAKDGKIT